MNFLKGSGPTEDEKAEHRVIKHTLSSQLSRTIKRLQQEHIGSDSAIRSGDHANAICNVLEAIFLHGIKASFATKLSGMFGSGKEEKGPVMSFWPFVMHFTHKDVVSQLNHLAHITTEIGQCRAWIRLALNDGLMESYAEAMLRDKDLLKYHYRSISYLRDEEHPTIMKNHLQGLEGFQFQLSYNSSVLNDWGVSALTLAGLWSIPQAPEAVTPSSPDVAMEATEGVDPILPSQGAAGEVKQVRSSRKGQRPSRRSANILEPEGVEETVSGSVQSCESAGARSEEDVPLVTGRGEEGPSSLPVDVVMSSTVQVSETEESSTAQGSETEKLSTDQVLDVCRPRGTSAVSSSRDEVRTEDDISPFSVGRELPSSCLSGNETFEKNVKGELSLADSVSKIQRVVQSDAENIVQEVAAGRVSVYSTLGSNSVVTQSSAEVFSAGAVERVGPAAVDRDAGVDRVLSGSRQSNVESRSVQLSSPVDVPTSLSIQTSQQQEETNVKETRSETLTSQDMYYDIYSRSRTETEASITSPSSNDEGDDVANVAAHLSAVRRVIQHAPQQQRQTSAVEMEVTESEEEVMRYGSYGNSLGVRSGWSSAGTKDSQTSDPGQPRAFASSKGSFDSLLKSYSPQGSLATTPAAGMAQILENLADLDSHHSELEVQEPPNLEESDELYREEYEVLPLGSSVTSGNADPRTKELMAQLTSIGREKGLDVQNFKCKDCERQIGLIFGKYRVCNYDGSYYCEECHVNEEAIIPARIILNWDFKKHKVAHSTKLFLLQVEEEPLINMDECNPDIYTYIREMSEVKTLRLQLKYVKAYLFTCNQSVAEDLRKRVWPKDYMLDRIHLYSVIDLLQVTSGQLQQHLKKVVKHATKHVYKCQLCSQKGFLCEVCNSPNPIYPFETDSTVRCDRCKAVFHAKCRTDNRPCPKCTRRDLRRSQFRMMEDTSPDFTFPV